VDQGCPGRRVTVIVIGRVASAIAAVNVRSIETGPMTRVRNAMTDHRLHALGLDLRYNWRMVSKKQGRRAARSYEVINRSGRAPRKAPPPPKTVSKRPPLPQPRSKG